MVVVAHPECHDDQHLRGAQMTRKEPRSTLFADQDDQQERDLDEEDEAYGNGTPRLAAASDRGWL
jgi:hypothetical protein